MIKWKVEQLIEENGRGSDEAIAEADMFRIFKSGDHDLTTTSPRP